MARGSSGDYHINLAICSQAFFSGRRVSMLRLMAVFFRLGMLNELAYRANFWVQTFESLINAIMVLGAVGVVFSQTNALGDWMVWELTALCGVYFIMLGGINMILSPSLSQFIDDVRQGTLDFTLTKPEDAQLLVSISRVQMWKLLDVMLGIGVVGYAVRQLGEQISWTDASLFGVSLLLGGIIVYSFWIMLATLAFWFIRVENIFFIFWSMYNAGRWPVTIYPGWLKWILTAIVPIAFAVTVPAEAIAGRLSIDTLWLAVGLAGVLLVASRQFWKFGVKHYAGASA
jgi:ABC-2 type transport system permease protein